MNARPPEPSLKHAGYRGIRLVPADAASGCLLSGEARWNQTEEDWRLLLRLGRGFGFENAAGELVASAVVMPYRGGLAWIGMVLVSASARRQGLATLLLRHALAFCRAADLVAMLDATPAGRTVYVGLGFRDLLPVTRWRGEAPGEGPPGGASTVRPGMIGAAGIGRWQRWDEPRFGADRGELLAALAAGRPDLAVELVGAAGELRGYGLGRTGRTAAQIGPVVAETEADGLRLIAMALGRARGPVLLDLPSGRSLIERELAARGFRPERDFMRMACGPARGCGRPDCIVAIAGPELG